MCGTLQHDNFQPAYHLPTAAGGLLGSDGAALTGQPGLAEVMFGFGALSWLVVGSIVLGRLYLRPMLPPPLLLPMLAIEVAPPPSPAWPGSTVTATTSTPWPPSWPDSAC